MSLSKLRVAAPALFIALSPLAETPSFAPAAGASVEKHFVTDQFLALKSKQTLIDGREQSDAERLMLAATQELRVTDEYRSTEAGRPRELRRMYTTGSSNVLVRIGDEGAQVESTVEGKSLLDGIGVVFTWVDEEEGFGKHYDAIETEESLLLGLEEDLDLRGLLPAAGVPAGGEWKVEPAVLASVFAHGGDLAIQHTGEVPDPVLRSIVLGFGGNPWRHFEGETKGAVTARHAAPRDGNGTQLGVITFEYELTTTVDQTKGFSEKLSFQEFRSGLKVDRASSTLELKGTGELVWNQALGHFSSLECKGEQTLSLSWAGRLETDEGSATLTENLAFEGTIEVAADARPRP